MVTKEKISKKYQISFCKIVRSKCFAKRVPHYTLQDFRLTDLKVKETN